MTSSPKTQTPTLDQLLAQSPAAAQNHQPRIMPSSTSLGPEQQQQPPQQQGSNYLRPPPDARNSETPSTSDACWGYNNSYGPPPGNPGYRPPQEPLSNGIDSRAPQPAPHSNLVNLLRNENLSPAQRPGSNQSPLVDALGAPGQPMSPAMQLRHSPVSPVPVSVYNQQGGMYPGGAPPQSSGRPMPQNIAHPMSKPGDQRANAQPQQLPQQHHGQPYSYAGQVMHQQHHLPPNVNLPPGQPNGTPFMPNQFANGPSSNPYMYGQQPPNSNADYHHGGGGDGLPGAGDYPGAPPSRNFLHPQQMQHHMQPGSNLNNPYHNSSMASTPPAMGSFPPMPVNPQQQQRFPMHGMPQMPGHYSNGPVPNNSSGYVGENSRDSADSSVHSKDDSDSGFHEAAPPPSKPTPKRAKGGGTKSRAKQNQQQQQQQQHATQHQQHIQQQPQHHEQMSHPPTPAGTSPAASSIHDDQDDSSLSSPSWSQTPMSPATIVQQGTPKSSKAPKEIPRETGGNLVQKLLGDPMQVQYSAQEWEDRKLFYDRLVQFCEAKQHPITGQPTVSKQTVDLFRLYVAVKQKGGFEEVCKKKLWRDLCLLFNIGQSNSASGQLKKQYSKVLFPFECAFDRGGVDPTPILASQESKKKSKPKPVTTPNSTGPPGTSSHPFREPTMMGPPSGPFPQPGDGQSQPQFSAQGYPQPAAPYPVPGGPRFGSQPGPSQSGVGAPISEMVCDPFDERPRPFPPASAPQQGFVQQLPPHYQGRGGPPQGPPSVYYNNQYNVPTPPAQQPEGYTARSFPAVNAQTSDSNNAPNTVYGNQIQQAQTEQSTYGQQSTSQDNGFCGVGDSANSGRGPYEGGQPPGYRPHPNQYVPPYSQNQNIPQGPMDNQPYGQSAVPGPPSVFQNDAKLSSHPQPHTELQGLPPTWNQQHPPAQKPLPPRMPASSPGQMPFTRAMIRERVVSSAGGSGASQASPSMQSLLPTSQQVPTSAQVLPPPPLGRDAKGVSTASSTQMVAYQMAASQRKESVFPPGSVEATEPELGRKRRKLLQKDIGVVEPWRFVMALKSGLLAETIWALNVLNVLLYDDSTVVYFGLSHLPGLLEAIMEYYRITLAEVFGSSNIPASNAETVVVDEAEDDVPMIVEEASTSVASFIISNPILSVENSENNCAPANGVAPRGRTVTSSKNYTFHSRTGKPVRFVHDASATGFNLNDFAASTRNCSQQSNNLRHRCLSNSSNRNLPEHKIVDLLTQQFKKTVFPASQVGTLNGFKTCPNDFKELLIDSLITKAQHYGSDSTNGSSIKRLKTDAGFNCIKTDSSNDDLQSETSVDSSIETESAKSVPCGALKVAPVAPNVEATVKSLWQQLVSVPFFYGNQKFKLSDEIITHNLLPVCTLSESEDDAIERCKSVSGILRGLSFIPGNETVMAKNVDLLQILAKILLLNHTHLNKEHPRSQHTLESIDPNLASLLEPKAPATAEAANVSAASATTTVISEVLPVAPSTVVAKPTTETTVELTEKDWWFDCLNWTRDDAFVILCNISAQVDLFNVDDSVSLNLLDALLHWATCPAAYAQDPLNVSSCLLSPLRYSLEILCKLSVQEHNVDLMLATPPWERMESFLSQLTVYLSPTEETPVREFAIVLLSSFAMGGDIASVYMAQETSVIQMLVTFLEQADSNMHQVVQQQGMNALRENPELMGTSVGMLRRAAHTLLYMSRIPENRYRFTRHQPRLLQFTMSQLMDSRVAGTIADVLFELQKTPTVFSQPPQQIISAEPVTTKSTCVEPLSATTPTSTVDAVQITTIKTEVSSQKSSHLAADNNNHSTITTALKVNSTSQNNESERDAAVPVDRTCIVNGGTNMNDDEKITAVRSQDHTPIPVKSEPMDSSSAETTPPPVSVTATE